MAFRSYWFRSDPQGAPDLSYSSAQLGEFNLIVGASASGKTRWLNSMWNLGRFVIAPGEPMNGRWACTFDVDGRPASYAVDVSAGEIVRERFEREEQVQLDRSDRDLTVLGAAAPQITARRTAAATFDGLAQIRDGVGVTLRRNFFAGEQETHAEQAWPAPPPELGRDEVVNLGLHPKAHWLETHRQFAAVFERFRLVFPAVEAYEFHPWQPNVPVLRIREHGNPAWILASELSSGMKKVLLVLTDLAVAPPGWSYLLDEIENSLGPGALEPLVEFLRERRDLQVVVSTHHPYVIHNVPPEEWLVFGRTGLEVTIRGGAENADRYGRSRQDRFTQLLSDPFYAGAA